MAEKEQQQEKKEGIYKKKTRAFALSFSFSRFFFLSFFLPPTITQRYSLIKSAVLWSHSV
jgi:hypothetical protein